MITTFFKKKETPEKKGPPTEKKRNKQSLLKITDHEIEDITGLLFAQNEAVEEGEKEFTTPIKSPIRYAFNITSPSHPKKRLKLSGPETSPSHAPPLQLTARKMCIPCLRPSSSFPDPPKAKEFYYVRQKKSGALNYAVMGRTSKLSKGPPIYYEVSAVVSHKEMKGSLIFLVHWAGFSTKYVSWEPVSHFNCCPELLLTYLNGIFTKPGQTPEIVRDAKKEITKQKYKIQTGFKQTDTNLWQINLELESKVVKTQYRKILKQYSQKIFCELGPSFPSVEIVNTIDFEVPPLNFTFVRDRFAGKGVHISDDSLIGCVCSGEGVSKDCCLGPDVECCPHLGGVQPPYNNKGRLVLKSGFPIYECNSRCSCAPDCGNRIVQRGSRVKTIIYKTPDKGWAIKATEDIPKGTFVVEYVGEVITFDEAEQRGKKYDAQGLTYLFDLDYDTTKEEGGEQFTIDAAFYGNTSHFINHSCDPNLAVYSCWISNLDIRLPQICLFAIKHIPAGTELTFNYQIDRVVSQGPTQSVSCRCGASNCVGVLHG